MIASTVSGTTAHVRGDMGQALERAYRSYVNRVARFSIGGFDPKLTWTILLCEGLPGSIRGEAT